MRVTFKTNGWGQHLATKDGSTRSNIARNTLCNRSVESCHHVQSMSVICRSPPVQVRHSLLGQTQVPGGGINTPNSGKDKTQFLHEMDKDTTTSPNPPRDSGLCRGSTWQRGLSTTDISVWFARLSPALWQLQSPWL